MPLKEVHSKLSSIYEIPHTAQVMRVNILDLIKVKFENSYFGSSAHITAGYYNSSDLNIFPLKDFSVTPDFSVLMTNRT